MEVIVCGFQRSILSLLRWLKENLPLGEAVVYLNEPAPPLRFYSYSAPGQS